MFPGYVMIQTVSLCNAQCIMCPYEAVSKEISHGSINDKLFRKIIDECSKHDVTRILLYLMNEPLMDRSIVKKINYAKEKNPKSIVHIVSNASLLTESLSIDIIQSRIDYVEFSVHGYKKATYEHIMKNLSHEKTIKNILRFIELSNKYGKDSNFVNIKILGIPGILDKREINESEKFWKKVGVNYSSYAAPISRAGNIKWISKTQKKSISGCNSIWRNDMIHILYDGTVILCCMDWKKEVILGNLNEDSIFDIWNSSKRKKIEAMIKGISTSPENFICKRCELAN